MQQAAELTEALRSYSSTHAPPPAPDLGAQQRAEAQLWAFYLEWSEIARAAIKDRRLLRELGLSQVKRGAPETRDTTPSSA